MQAGSVSRLPTRLKSFDRELFHCGPYQHRKCVERVRRWTAPEHFFSQAHVRYELADLKTPGCPNLYGQIYVHDFYDALCERENRRPSTATDIYRPWQLRPKRGEAQSFDNFIDPNKVKYLLSSINR